MSRARSRSAARGGSAGSTTGIEEAGPGGPASPTAAPAPQRPSSARLPSARSPSARSPSAQSPLDASFYARPVVEVARELVGCVVDVGGVSGRIVEAEAYHQTEPACHAFAGVTPRTRTLFGPPGQAYVYRSYGIHAMLNAVCEDEGTGAAVLVRALEPLDGLDEMRARRGLERLEDLCSGPGKLCQALGIGLALDGTDLATGPIRILAGDTPPLTASPRIGITKAAGHPWRFSEIQSRFVSRPRP